MAKICDLCKSENDDQNQFCDKCGNPLINFEAPQPSTPSMSPSGTAQVDPGAVDNFANKKKSKKSSGFKFLIIPILLLIAAIVYFGMNISSQNKMKQQANEVVAKYMEDLKNEEYSKALEDGIGVSLGKNMEDSFKEFLLQLTPSDPRNAQLYKTKLDLANIAEGIDRYYYINRKFPSSLSELSPVIIEKVPAPPGGEEFAYEYDSEADNYTIYVKGIHFDANGLPKNFPAYSKKNKLQAPGEKKIFTQWKLTNYEIIDTQLAKDKARVTVRETYQYGTKKVQDENTYIVLHKKDDKWVIDPASSPIQEINLTLSYTQMEPFSSGKTAKPPEKDDNSKASSGSGSSRVSLGMLLLSFSKVGTRDALITRSQKQYRITRDALEKIGLALKRYYNSNDGKFPLSLQWLIPKYLKDIPENPVLMEDTFTRSYQVSEDREQFTIYCEGQNFRSLSVEPNFPQYTSRYRFLTKSSQIPEPEVTPEKEPDQDTDTDIDDDVTPDEGDKKDVKKDDKKDAKKPADKKNVKKPANKKDAKKNGKKPDDKKNVKKPANKKDAKKNGKKPDDKKNVKKPANKKDDKKDVKKSGEVKKDNPKTDTELTDKELEKEIERELKKDDLETDTDKAPKPTKTK